MQEAEAAAMQGTADEGSVGTPVAGFQHEWMRRAAQAVEVDVAVRDAHAQEVQPEVDGARVRARLHSEQPTRWAAERADDEGRALGSDRLDAVAFYLDFGESSFVSNGARRGLLRPTPWAIIVYTHACVAHSRMPFSTLRTRSTRETLRPALPPAGSVEGAQAAGLDRQTDAACSAYRLLQSPAGRSTLFVTSIYP